MTININLLPWREKIREQEKQKFLGIGAAIVISMLLLNAIFFFIINGKVSHQLARNDFLQTQINSMNAQLKQKSKLDTQKIALTSQMQTLVMINNQRIRVAQLLNLLPKMLPENVYLSSIVVKNTLVALQGEAPVSTQASTLVASIEQQPQWFNTHLEEIASNEKVTNKLLFRITFEME